MKNYEMIISSLDYTVIPIMMRELGVEVAQETDEAYIFPTVCHNHINEGGSNKLYFYKDSKIFVCYTNCGTMNIFSFLKNYYTAQEIDYDWGFDVYNKVINYSLMGKMGSESTFVPIKVPITNLRDKYKARRVPLKLETYPIERLDMFSKYYPIEWLYDGINEAAMDKFQIRYSITYHRIIIPHFDVNGNLVGIRARVLDPKEIEGFGKYVPMLIGEKWYSHPLGQNLYGLNKTKDAIRESGVAIIFESEKSVLQMESFKRPNLGVAVCGSNFNKFQLNILLKAANPQEIVIAFDKEEEEGLNYFYKLRKLAKKYIDFVKVSIIYDTEGLLDMKDSPTDKGEEVFNKLLERRIAIK